MSRHLNLKKCKSSFEAATFVMCQALPSCFISSKTKLFTFQENTKVRRITGLYWYTTVFVPSRDENKIRKIMSYLLFSN